MAANRRVLHIVEAFCGGVARHLSDLIPLQVAAGWTVELLYNDSPERFDSMSANTLATLHHFGVQTYPLTMRREIGMADLKIARRIMSFITSKAPYDVLHAHSSKAGAYVRLHKQAAPILYTPHALITMDPKISSKKALLFSMVERWLARNCSAIILVSENERANAESIGLPSHLLHVVPHGIPLRPPASREEARAALGIQDERIVVGFVGRFISQKAPEVAVAAFCQLPDAVLMNATLVLVGYGPEEDQIVSIRNMYPKADIVIIKDGHGPSLIPGFDIYLLTSRYESFGYVLLEAAISGVVPVATQTGIAQDLIQDGANGQIIAIDDVPGTTATLAELITHPEKLSEMSKYIKASSHHFSDKSMNEQTLHLYEACMAQATSKS